MAESLYHPTTPQPAARRAGAGPQEIMEAIWVAVEMRAGGAYAHATRALHALDES